MIAPARTAAFRALHAVTDGCLDLPAALESSRHELKSARDRALTHEIVTGTLRWRRALDHLVVAFSRRPLARIDRTTLTVLRLSAYQILHLDRVPASAVVGDAVDLARATGTSSASGFVNAVLRSLIRTRHALPLPPRPSADDTPAALNYLGIAHSHPAWLVERWLARVGLENAERWVRFNNRPAPLTLRVNTLQATVEEARRTLQLDSIETELTPYAPTGLVVRSGQLLARLDDGLVFIQDEASQLVTLAVGAAPGERVLDLCAAPGGKTTAVAADMHGRGLLVAADVRVRRVALLRDTVRRSGATTIRIVRVAPDRSLPFAATFERVLVDAPCSGLGTLRRDPDVKWRRQPSDLPALAANQLRLLERAAAVVRPSGRLVYSTCSSEPEENEHVVAAFLERHPVFEQVDLGTDPSIPEGVRPLVEPSGAIRTCPHDHGLEAFYAAALQRRH